MSFRYLTIESERFITSYQSNNKKVIISQGAVKTANQYNHLHIFYVFYYYCDYRFQFNAIGGLFYASMGCFCFHLVLL
jgi:hypothetical protein